MTKPKKLPPRSKWPEYARRLFDRLTVMWMCKLGAATTPKEAEEYAMRIARGE